MIAKKFFNYVLFRMPLKGIEILYLCVLCLMLFRIME
jgi:hypothetical protein